MLGRASGTWASRGAEDWSEMVFKVLLTQLNPSYILQRVRSTVRNWGSWCSRQPKLIQEANLALGHHEIS